jgi:hypothetical protein
MHTLDVVPEPVLQLRRRDAEWVDRPATLDEFTRPAPSEARDRHAALTELLVGDLLARAHYEIESLAAGRLTLSCEMPRFGIPLDAHEAPAIDDWRIVEQLAGDLLDAPDGRPEHSLAAQVRRGLIAVAGALPLLMSPMLAHAGAPTPAGQLGLERSLVAFAPPKLPADGPPPASEPAPAAEGPQPSPPATTTTTAPALTPIATPKPRAEESLTLTGTTVWAGLLGKSVQLSMKSGAALDGTVVAQSGSHLALARSNDGTIVSVPKTDVAGVRLVLGVAAHESSGAAAIGERPTNDGRGLQAGGIVMITLGSIFALSGTVMLAISPWYLFISLPLLLPGLAVIGGGASLLVSAGKKRKAFRNAWGIPSAKLQVAPTMGLARNGGQAGLVLRF